MKRHPKYLKVKRLKYAILAAAMLLTCALAGCGNGGNNGGGGNAGGSGGGSRVQKDTLIVAKNEDVASLDPSLAINQKSFTVYGQIFEGLVRLDPETGEVVPCLATQWEQLDETTWHFTLREGVKFHDGNTMTSADVVCSFERIMTGIASSYVDYIESVEADGDYAVTMHIKMPYAQIIQALTYPAAVVVSKAAVEQYGEDFAQHPVGTGPYAFDSRMIADSITLKAFGDYWGEKAKTENLIFKVIPEGTQRTIMLENGEVDIICDVLSNDAVRVDEAPNLTLIHETGYKYYGLYFKCDSQGPTSNKLVRQAMEYAIDKQAMVDAAMSGYGQVGSLYSTPPTAGYNASKDRGNLYNPDTAKDLLAQAGYPNGFDLDVYVRTGQPYEELATIFQDQMKAININVNLISLDSNAIDEMVYSGQEVPIRFSFYNNICGDVDFIMQKLLPDTYGQIYFNDKMNDLISRARAETDVAKRQLVYDEFYDLMAEDVPQVAFFYEEILMGLNSNVEGFHLNPLGAHQYASVAVYQ
ncbi:ABC transporter substrate-binding protein [Pseudoflavonifractor sp. 60]|uniref:ABC transporter substrate-binding protein n=1 Tax=Pseudoflavonifractor sp. 60 TaxID=2304576 RepID=UPI00136D150F|nr:ABC transporter substrate-binding protein [Pseudoflavonifractor sp. 60]NBI65312.1 ABC transporter substrate-binding protein [Pseudoflavonifractor sp. 60]